MKEIWKPIKDFDGNYAISSYGNVRREKPGIGTWIGRILKQRKHNQGYSYCTLYSKDGMKSFLIHRLVAREFLGKCREGIEVNHKDLNKRNNHLSNLEYVTSKQNKNHASSNGITNRGELNGMSKLTEEDVINIRNKYKPSTRWNNEFSYSSLAKEFKTSPMNICRIINKKYWKHV